MVFVPRRAPALAAAVAWAADAEAADALDAAVDALDAAAVALVAAAVALAAAAVTDDWIVASSVEFAPLVLKNEETALVFSVFDVLLLLDCGAL